MLGTIRRNNNERNRRELSILQPGCPTLLLWAPWVPHHAHLFHQPAKEGISSGVSTPGHDLLPDTIHFWPVPSSCILRYGWDKVLLRLPWNHLFINGDTCGVSVRKWLINHWNVSPKQIYQRSRKCIYCPHCQTQFSCSWCWADGWGEWHLPHTHNSLKHPSNYVYYQHPGWLDSMTQQHWKM